MEPEQPNPNEEYTTLVCSTKMVDPHQTPILSYMESSIGRDIYEKINLNRPLFIPPHTSVTTGADAGPSSQYSDHPVGITLNITTTSGQ
jgi:hypothetical protein